MMRQAASPKVLEKATFLADHNLVEWNGAGRYFAVCLELAAAGNHRELRRRSQALHHQEVAVR